MFFISNRGFHMPLPAGQMHNLVLYKTHFLKDLQILPLIKGCMNAND